jgi:hypothetical protein
MRLRYLHLENYPPISNIKVCFASGSPMARDCAIRFVVGVNGNPPNLTLTPCRRPTDAA